MHEITHRHNHRQIALWATDKTVECSFKSNFFIYTGKHRKHPGGRGNAGSLTHHRINFDK